MTQRQFVVIVALDFAAEEVLHGQAASWPVAVPRVTQDYGCHNCAADGFHSGIDLKDALFDCENATVPVHPVFSTGTVVRTMSGCTVGDTECGRAFGNHVIVRHSAQLYSLYAHLNSIAVSVNDVADRAQARRRSRQKARSFGRGLPASTRHGSGARGSVSLPEFLRIAA